MGALTRDLDWAATPLGPAADWPQALQETLRLILNTRHPMLILWGPEAIQLYNDAYRDVIGPQRHPSSLGRPARESWAGIWDIVGPQLDRVMRGSELALQDMPVPFAPHTAMREAWLTYSYSPIDVEGGVGGVLAICNDVTKAHQARELLRLQSEQLRLMFERAPGFIAVLTGPDHRFELVNDTYRLLVGGRDLIGLSVREAMPEVTGQGFLELLDTVRRTGVAHVGTRVPLTLDATENKPQREVILDFVYSPIVDPDGTPAGIFVQGSDVTEQVRAEERLLLVNRELRHRGKNLLSMVGAIAAQTLRGVPQLPAFRDRIQAFDAANDILTVQGRAAASLGDLVAAVLDPYRSPNERITIGAPPLVLGARHALTLSLAVHELAVNATKYGALSNDTGRVSVTWAETVEDGVPVFRFDWVESGGPPVLAPTRTGFGSTILRSVLTNDFGGTVDIRFDPAGLTCRLTAPMAGICEAVRTDAMDDPE